MGNTTDLMIDTEFLSFNFNSAILSIGLVGFNINESDFDIHSDLYLVPSLDSQKGVAIDESVFKFWLKAEDNAKDAILEADERCKCSIVQALLKIEDYFKYEGKMIKRVWSHGGACDVPLIAQTFRDYGRNVPWGYRDPRDTRTLYDYNQDVKLDDYLKDYRYEEPEHHALWDAIRQARAVHAVHHSIKRRLA